MVILSLANHVKYSRIDLQKYFDCSKRKIDDARKWKSANENFTLPQKKRYSRNTLNLPKCEHFLDFIFSSGLIQDAAYGVSKLKFDCGETQILPRAILTTKYSHTISFYKDSCNDVGYQPLSGTYYEL